MSTCRLSAQRSLVAHACTSYVILTNLRRSVRRYIVANGNNGRNTGSAAGKGPASSSEVFGTVQQQVGTKMQTE
jgi:hypothetical protein